MLLLVAALALFTAAVGSALFLLPADEAPPRGKAAPAEAKVEAAPDGPRRLPVAGREGSFLVVEADGSSYLEEPGGRRTMLAEAATDAAAGDVVRKVVERAKAPRREPGQLVVLDRGVVDVPKDAVITFVGRDRVVALDTDGSASVYHADGRVEHESRPGRR
jgi:hypothetical protein